MTNRRGVSGIVLAGGRSSRFPGDKLSVPVDGVPLLDRAVAAVFGVAAEVLVVGRPSGLPTPTDQAVRLVADPVPYQGPLAGLVAGLAAATHEHVVGVAGDMPYLDPRVLRQLALSLLERPGCDVVLLGLGPTNAPQPLPMAIRRSAQARASEALEGGERSLGRFLRLIRLHVLAESAWRRVDPDARTLLDVDRPSDVLRAAQSVDRWLPES
jgi:molybdopterin-guanine dinucleotide biosynthesis protein A